MNEGLKFSQAQRSKLVFYHEDLSGVTHMLNIDEKARIYNGNEHRKIMSKVGKVLYKLSVLKSWLITS